MITHFVAAAGMLRRQQAKALVDARKTIVRYSPCNDKKIHATERKYDTRQVLITCRWTEPSRLLPRRSFLSKRRE
jgi:hypothetical protein